MTQRLALMMIVDDVEIASYVSAMGVDRLFIDLEVLGKQERQGHLDTVKSTQSPEIVTRMREACPDAHILVRVNPWHDGTVAEVNDVVARGADSVMLPMFHDAATFAKFAELLDGRAEAVPLIETVGALSAVPEIVEKYGLARAHIGLNDLHLERGDPMMFIPLADGSLDEAAACFVENGISLGIGGVARAGEGKIPPDVLLGEHVRLGSSMAILSRTFHRRAQSLKELKSVMDFGSELQKLQAIYSGFLSAGSDELEENKLKFRSLVADVVVNDEL